MNKILKVIGAYLGIFLIGFAASMAFGAFVELGFDFSQWDSETRMMAGMLCLIWGIISYFFTLYLCEYRYL